MPTSSDNDDDDILAAFLKPVPRQAPDRHEIPGFQATPRPYAILLLDATEKTGEGRSLDYQVNAIIGTGRAALFTTGITIFHLIYDLATHSEYIEPIRQELKELGDVPMNRANVAKLIKLDSFYSRVAAIQQIHAR